MYLSLVFRIKCSLLYSKITYSYFLILKVEYCVRRISQQVPNWNEIKPILCFLLGYSQASEFYVPTFRNTLFVKSRLNPPAPQNPHFLTVMLTLYLDCRYAGVLPASCFPTNNFICALYLSKTCLRQVIVFIRLQETPKTIICIEVPFLYIIHSPTNALFIKL